MGATRVSPPPKNPPKFPRPPIDFSDLHSTLTFRPHVYTQTSQQNSVKHRARQYGPPTPLPRGACSRGGWSPHARLPRGCPRSPTAEDFRALATYQGMDARGTTPRKNPRSALPGVDADACGIAPRKNPRSALPGVDADARGIVPRKTPRSTVPGVAADACGTAPRKTPRPVGRGRRPRGRRPNRRRSLNHVRPSLPRLSPDSPGIDGEIALLRSLTNRLLSTRPLDYTQVNRCLRLIIRGLLRPGQSPQTAH